MVLIIEPTKKPVYPIKLHLLARPRNTLRLKTSFANCHQQTLKTKGLSAAGEILLLAERSADSCVAIAEASVIPLLVGLLSTPDSRTQEHAVTALLNLSICEDDIGSFISCGAVPGLFMCSSTYGDMEARENAAATLFSLSVVDENKVRVGKVLKGGRRNEVLAILAVLARHSEGKAAEAAEAVLLVVEASETGSLQNREIIAAAVLVHLSCGDQQHLAHAQELGVMGSLLDLALNGSDRGKRKAAQLLAGMNRFTERDMC